MAKVNPIPKEYATITPYLAVKNARKAIEFYKKAFGAIEAAPPMDWDGRIGHAELKIGGGSLMMADEFEGMNQAPVGMSPVNLVLYVENCDEVVERAVQNGAELVRPVEDRFYGDRVGVLRDPFGHSWSICQHIEDVSPEEITRRSKEAMDKQ